MNCECNNNSNRVKPRIKHVYGNVLRIAIPLTLRTLVKDGDEMIVNDTDFIPSSDNPVRVVFSKGKTNYPLIATMDGNVAIIEDKGKIPVGTYDISVECYDNLGNPYRFKQNAVLYVTDTTAEAGIDTEIEYEAQTWYLDAAVFLATTEIGEIGDVIDAKLDDVFGDAVYDANAKEIRFYNKNNSRVLATIDSRPFIVDGMVADVYIDVSRQVLVVVLNEDAGGRRFSVPLYLVFNSYYKKDEVDRRISLAMTDAQLQFNQKLPLIVPVTQSGSTISSTMDFGVLNNAIREDGREVVACINNSRFYQLLGVNGDEIVFSAVNAADGFQTLLAVHENNVWALEDVEIGTGGSVEQVQADWNQTNTSAKDFIKNKPTIPSNVSDLTNDSGFTSNAGTITGITMNGESKGTSGVVDLGTVITAHQDISGKANASDVYTKTQTDTLLSSKLSKSDVSVETQGDGTVDINVKDDTYNVNLNHTHEGMAKLVVDTAANLPDVEDMEEDTIYGEVDDGEISILYVGGYPFYGGGGGSSSSPVLRRPTDGSTIDMGSTTSGTVSKTINVKGKNLTQALTIELDGTGYTFGVTQPTGVTIESTTELTVTAAAANSLTGVDIVVVYTGNDTDEDASGTLSISSSSPDTISVEVSLVTNKVTLVDLAAIKLTGSQWLVTDYYPNPKTEFELELKFDSNSNTNSGSSAVNNFLRCFPTGSEYFYATVSSASSLKIEMLNQQDLNQKVVELSSLSLMTQDNSVFSYKITDSTTCTFGFNPGGSTSGYPTMTLPKKTNTETNPLAIGLRQTATGSYAFNRYDLTIYRFTIYEDGVAVRDYVPKKKNGVTGLLDVATNGTGLFLSSGSSTELVPVALTSNS